MRVRLTRKLAEKIDGVDLSANKVGDVLELEAPEASLLLAEGWAIPERRGLSGENPDQYVSSGSHQHKKRRQSPPP